MPKITVGKGDSTRDFSIHKALLTARSKFFAKAMGKGWKEAEEKVVELRKDDPEVFAIYSSLLYTETIPAFDESPNRMVTDSYGDLCCDSTTTCTKEYELLSQVYVLAEKPQDIQARNTTVDAIVSKITHESNVVNHNDGPCLPKLVATKTMYANTPGHCTGRQALLDWFVWYGKNSSMRNIGREEGIPRKPFYDLAHTMMYCRPHHPQDLPHQVLHRYQEMKDEEYKWEMTPWWNLEYRRQIE
jgi:hypothetical protein